jgi:hypothetical protein
MLAHESTDSLGHTNSAFTNNNDSKQTHTLHKMRLLEAQHAPRAGYRDNCNSLDSRNNVPNQVHKSVILLYTLECWCHGGECPHGDSVYEEHETKRKVQFGVAGSPCEELSGLAFLWQNSLYKLTSTTKYCRANSPRQITRV